MESTSTPSKEIPEHVPEELFWPHKLNDFTCELDDPFIAAARLHEGPGIIWAKEASLGKPAWVLTQHDLIRDAYLDFEHFSSTRDDNTGDVLGKDMVRMIPVEVDPPQHQHYRRILNPLFTPKHVNTYGEMVQQTCDRLMDGIPDPANCEFISEFAELFPNSIFLSLLGLPQEQLPQFLAWERQLLRSGDQADFEKSSEAAGLIFKYLHGFITEQKDNPQRTEFIDALLNGTIEGRPLNDLEILGYCMLFYVAGLDTVYSTLGWIMRHLANDQPLQDHLRSNPQEIAKAVEEFSRAFAVPAPHRRVTEDFDFHGVRMRKNDVVLLPLYLASRDPRVYEDPHKIDINRGARNLSFATGPHTCLGVHLAKREMRTVLESFLSRFSSIRMQEGEHYEYHTGGVLGVDRLPLVLDR
jgi:cytochrome P450